MGHRRYAAPNKVNDFHVVITDLDNIGTVVFLNGIDEGTQFFNRISRKIVPQKIDAYLEWAYSVTQETSYCIRSVFLYDRQPNGNLPELTDILKDTDGQTNIWSPFNYNNYERFQVLREDLLRLTPDSNNSVVFQHAEICDLEELPVNYNGPDFIIESIDTGSFVHLILSDAGTGPDLPFMVGTYRFCFKDY